MFGDRERFFSDDEICELLERAERAGFSLERGSELEKLSLADVERLLDRMQ